MFWLVLVLGLYWIVYGAAVLLNIGHLADRQAGNPRRMASVVFGKGALPLGIAIVVIDIAARALGVV